MLLVKRGNLLSLAVLKYLKAAPAKIRDQIVLLVDDDGVQYNFFHLLPENELAGIAFNLLRLSVASCWLGTLLLRCRLGWLRYWRIGRL